MKKTLLACCILIALLAVGGYLLRPHPSMAKIPLSLPKPTIEPPPKELAPKPNSLPAPPPKRDALFAFLERVGRAKVLRDEKTLTKLFSAPPPVTEADLPWLVEQARASELFAAVGAIEWLVRLRRDEAIPALADALNGPGSVFLKDVAAEALGILRGPVAEATLIQALGSELDGSVRAHVAQALSRYDTADALYALAQAVKSDRDPIVRKAAAEALASKPSQDFIHLFLEQLPIEPDPNVQLVLLSGAYARGGEATLPALRSAVQSNPQLRSTLEQETKRQGPQRYAHRYAPDFFALSAPIPWTGTRIGITVEGTSSLSEVAALLFSTPPLDRYREFFTFRRADELAADLRDGVPAPRAYDSRGAPLPHGMTHGPLDGTIFIHWRDPKTFGANILGYSEGSEAYVTAISLVHEVGHALAQLADEYTSPIASKNDAANLDAPGQAPKWKPLIEQGLLGPAAPRDPDHVIPGAPCHMNNRPEDDRFCPVCQLEIIARICELTGCPVPW